MQRVPTTDDFPTHDSRIIRPRFGRPASSHDLRAAPEQFPQDLIRGLHQGRGVLFVGPGISKAAGLSLRESLQEAMCNALRQSIALPDANDLEAFLSKASPPEIAQALHDQLGQEAYVLFLQSHLEHRDVPPPPLLYALRALPFRVIITTNFDRLLERTYGNPLEDEPELDVVVPAPGIVEPIPEPTDRPVLVKLFGDVRDPESLILTADDYESYFRLRPELVSRLKALLEVGSALFIGYDLRDPEFRRVYAQVGALLARARKRAYALMDDVNRFEAAWWTQRALSLVGGPGADKVEASLRELNRQLQRQSHPGMELETDGPGAAARGTWSLAPVLQAQLESTAQSWLIAGPRGPRDLYTGYIPISLLSEGDRGIPREQRLPELLAETEEISRQLRAPVAIDLASAIEQTPRVLVLGRAGSGKTTMLLQLLQTRCEAVLESGERTLIAYLPMRFIAAAPGLSLMECLAEHLQTLAPKEQRDQVESAVMDALIEGRALLLLDGLDDVEPQAEAGVYERLLAFVSDCPKVKLVLTCRSGAFEGDKLPPELELAPYEVSSLTPEQQSAFVRDRLRHDPALAESLIALLRAGVAPWAERYASNPLHLTQICVKFQDDGRFADSRSALYEAFLGILLRRANPGDENTLYAFDKELILQAIALYAMLHPHEPLDEALLLDLAEREMARTHIAPRKDVSKRVDARDAIQEIVSGSGILVGPGPRKAYDFRHNALKEYLVARRLMAARDPETHDIIHAHLADKRWAGVWRLTAAMSEDATGFLEQLDASLTENSKLIPRCFDEATRVQPRWLVQRLGEQQGATPEFGSLLVRLHNQLSPQEALDLYGEILWRDQETYLREGRRTDARALYIALSGLYRMIEEEGAMAHQAAETIAGWRGAGEPSAEEPWPCAMIDIPAGVFLMGEAGNSSSRYITLPAFQIGRDPVTNAQYQAFHPGHTLAGVDRGEDFLGPNQPVVNVSWFEAWVCARWYSCRLPTECEWEKAASWDPGVQVKRPYPWGPQWQAGRCNTLESWNGNGRTTPVDRYAEAGESPSGCRDMAGNVLEWTRDRGHGSPERRILKGGSWQSSPLLAQTSTSIWLKPSYRGLGVGFRLCRSLPRTP